MKTALVTGASGGIGYEFARLFAGDSCDLILVSRNREKLEEIATAFEQEYGVNVDVLAYDLSAEGAGEELHKVISEQGKEIDYLVNNAGFGYYKPFLDGDLEIYRRMMVLNMTALTELTYLFAGDMVKRGEGRILNVASTAGFQPDPFLAVYGATKAYVLNFTEALSAELEGTGVTVSALCPGPTETGFSAAANMESARLFKKGVMSAGTVAKVGYKGMMKGQMTIIPGLKNKALAFASYTSPSRKLTVAITKWVMREG